MPGRVLIVDDERSMGDLLQTDLKLRGHEPQAVTSGDDALRALHNSSFDVVLTDVKMPGMTGIQLCEQIVANRPDVPVVVMTAFGSLETAIAAMRAGAFGPWVMVSVDHTSCSV